MESPEADIDDALLARARRGDRQAHATLYRVYAPMVFTVAVRMLGSRAAAEDVLQDSFVEVIRKSQDFRGDGGGDGGIRGWIKRIAINKCLSQLRSPWVVRRVSVADEAPDATSSSVDGQRDLERALGELSPTARAVVWLHKVEGYTHREIGRLMGQSTSFSKSQFSRACAELRTILGQEETDGETESCLGALKTVSRP